MNSDPCNHMLDMDFVVGTVAKCTTCDIEVVFSPERLQRFYEFKDAMPVQCRHNSIVQLDHTKGRCIECDEDVWFSEDYQTWLDRAQYYPHDIDSGRIIHYTADDHLAEIRAMLSEEPLGEPSAQA